MRFYYYAFSLFLLCGMKTCIICYVQLSLALFTRVVIGLCLCTMFVQADLLHPEKLSEEDLEHAVDTVFTLKPFGQSVAELSFFTCQSQGRGRGSLDLHVVYHICKQLGTRLLWVPATHS